MFAAQAPRLLNREGVGANKQVQRTIARNYSGLQRPGGAARRCPARGRTARPVRPRTIRSASGRPDGSPRPACPPGCCNAGNASTRRPEVLTSMQGATKELWKQLCEQAATEQNPERLMDLVNEINRLLDEKQERLNNLRADSKGTP